ncbi:MAG: hypothetical protein HKP61_00890 [Dactylosporangium sp.]|nr:hypothetical protein [Dactylosporangium sp.]NNJ59526.1 hypothetical protein [Dactylosporangium sp.]
MRPISWSEFERHFERSKRAFHLELRDTYNVEQEREPLRTWLAGIPDDFAWRRDWLSFVRRETDRGVQIQRVRVVNEPPSGYQRWARSLDPQNIDAGEDLRYLPRRLTDGIEFPLEDLWLFDDNHLLWSLFQPDGGAGGFAVEDDPAALAQCIRARDQTWPRAVPYAQYVTG